VFEFCSNADNVKLLMSGTQTGAGLKVIVWYLTAHKGVLFTESLNALKNLSAVPEFVLTIVNNGALAVLLKLFAQRQLPATHFITFAHVLRNVCMCVCVCVCVCVLHLFAVALSLLLS